MPEEAAGQSPEPAATDLSPPIPESMATATPVPASPGGSSSSSSNEVGAGGRAPAEAADDNDMGDDLPSPGLTPTSPRFVIDLEPEDRNEITDELDVTSEEFKRALGRVSAVLGSKFMVSGDGLRIVAPAADLVTIARRLEILTGEAGWSGTVTPQRSRSPFLSLPPSPAAGPSLSNYFPAPAAPAPAPVAPPPPPPPPALSPRPPSKRPSLPSSASFGSSLAAEAAESARKKPRITIVPTDATDDPPSLSPPSPVSSMAAAAAALARQHGEYHISTPPRHAEDTPDEEPRDPWESTRKKMRHVDPPLDVPEDP